MTTPKKHILCFELLLYAAALALVGSQERANAYGPDEGAKDAAIVYRFQRGLDKHEQEWAIHPDGLITKEQARIAKLPQNEVTELLDEIAKLGFFEMKGKYPPPRFCHQCSSYRIIVRHVGREKTVSFWDGSKGIPAQLIEIASKIQGLLRSTRTR